MFDIDELEVRRLLGELVAIDSVNPSLVPGAAGEKAAAEYIVQYLESLGLPARLDPVVPGRPNAVGVLPAGKSTAPGQAFDARHGLILNGHIDTVGTSGMDGDPLDPRLEGDRVYGRGSFDMKGGLVMALVAMAAVKRAGVTLDKSVLFTGVVDEEYASLGTESVVNHYSADAAIITEPTALTLHVAHKGFAWVTAETFGKAAHGSDYASGVDAITRMGRLLTALEDLQATYLARDPHPLVGHRSIHASLIEGGKELSTYPEYCVARLERRTLPSEEPSVIMEELETICASLSNEDPDFRYALSLDFTRNGYEVDPEEPVARVLARGVQSVTGRAVEYRGSSGWLDSALLGGAGIPTVIFGPDGAGAHAAREYVTLSSIVDGARALAQTIVELC